jgi:photosystem II stability/assembly factor-like uncharacterized protein
MTSSISPTPPIAVLLRGLVILSLLAPAALATASVQSAPPDEATVSPEARSENAEQQPTAEPQPVAGQQPTVEPQFDPALYGALEYRNIGPFRGGRSAAVTGVPGQTATYYFGAAGGGVWGTDDAGQTWRNLSDGYFGGSIGAVAVSEWDPNVIYAGGGEVTVRGNVSHGNGVWKSLDRGKTWAHMGLADSRHIPRIRIHPKDPNLVYVAALGHLYGPNEERGVYRSKDGGATWQRILFANENAGAVDLVMDPSNPRILYASTWRIRRTPYSLESGGEGCALWKSTDGGDTWTEITHSEGLPKGEVGIIGVSISSVNPERVFAIIEGKQGGVFRSDDGGETWERVNQERKLRQRAWYYSRIYADTQDPDTVYVVNVGFWRSKDGGRTFSRISTPHGDHHDLWIAPSDNQRMAIADDGGAQISFNAGEGWTTYKNQPTAQFYRVTTDDSFPYRVYGAQQDNSTVRIRHRSNRGGIGEADWEATAGGESGWIAIDPKDHDVVFGGSYGGFLVRTNHRTLESRLINVWPDNPMGYGAEGMDPRFQWNFPIVYSRHEANTLYAAGNRLYRTRDDGQSWQTISPDLTRNNPAWLGASGGPITKDNTGVEYYCTIFAMAESVSESGVIWVGSDDGLIHISRDGGNNWQNITPGLDKMPEMMQINCIEAHPTIAGGAYVAGTRYKSDDFAPYLYRTLDYGQTWEIITTGIPADAFTRAIRADPKRPGLLYSGTESGLYVSFDDGARWQTLQLNLPIVPVTDLALKNDDLIVATQGRSFWILDDLTPLHQLSEAVASSQTWLFEPRSSYRMGGGFQQDSLTLGQNPRNGVVVYYYLDEQAAEAGVSIDILEADGSVIRSFPDLSDVDPDTEATANSDADAEQASAEEPEDAPPSEAGMNRFVWNIKYPDASDFEGMIMWAGSVAGPKAVPGHYQIRLNAGPQSLTVPFHILADPRSGSSQQDFQDQFDFLITARDKLSQTHEAIVNIRQIKSELSELEKKLQPAQGGVDRSAAKAEQEATAQALLNSVTDLRKALTAIEEKLYQTKNQSNQDPLNFPIRLNNKLSALANTVAFGDFRPTDQALQVYLELSSQIDRALSELAQRLEKDLPALNERVREARIPAIGTR